MRLFLFNVRPWLGACVLCLTDEPAQPEPRLLWSCSWGKAVKYSQNRVMRRPTTIYVLRRGGQGANERCQGLAKLKCVVQPQRRATINSFLQQLHRGLALVLLHEP